MKDEKPFDFHVRNYQMCTCMYMYVYCSGCPWLCCHWCLLLLCAGYGDPLQSTLRELVCGQMEPLRQEVSLHHFSRSVNYCIAYCTTGPPVSAGLAGSTHCCVSVAADLFLRLSLSLSLSCSPSPNPSSYLIPLFTHYGRNVGEFLPHSCVKFCSLCKPPEDKVHTYTQG